MHYVALLYGDETEAAEPGTPEWDAELAGYDAFDEIAGDRTVGGEALLPTSTTRTVRRDPAGALTVTDGPYAEVVEALGGFYVLETGTEDEAIELARALPAATSGGVELQGSGREVAGEGFLLVGLDRTFAVRGSDPAHGFVWRLAAEDGETGQGGPGAAVAAVAADLDAFTSPGSLEQRFEHGDQSWVARDAEVGPVQVVVGPRRLPPLVEVQPEVRDHLAGVGLGAAEGHRRHLRAVGEHDTAAVEVRVESAVLVGRVRARSLLGSRVPERPALVAHDDDPGLGHVVITYVAGSVAVLRPAFEDTFGPGSQTL